MDMVIAPTLFRWLIWCAWLPWLASRIEGSTALKALDGATRTWSRASIDHSVKVSIYLEHSIDNYMEAFHEILNDARYNSKRYDEALMSTIKVRAPKTDQPDSVRSITHQRLAIIDVKV